MQQINCTGTTNGFMLEKNAELKILKSCALGKEDDKGYISKISIELVFWTRTYKCKRV